VTTTDTTNPFPFAFGNQPAQQQEFEGSGIVYNSGGYIVTNNHVIANAYNANDGTLESSAKIEVFFPSDVNKSYSAKVVGRDETTDLAVLKIDGTGFPTATFGNSDNIQVGDVAIAIGNPGGMELVGSVTMGVISGLNRTITTDNNKTMSLIQTDAAINAGNSGGALCNAQGEVIGVNVLKVAATGYEGLGFAIPGNTVKSIADNIIQNGYVTGRPLLGISFDTRYTSDVAKQNNLPNGLYVADITLMGPADKAGIKKSDIITKFNGNAVTTYDALVTDIAQHKPGDVINVEYYRDSDKSTKTVDVTLGESKS
jgi:serine protease Do